MGGGFCRKMRDAEPVAQEVSCLVTGSLESKHSVQETLS